MIKQGSVMNRQQIILLPLLLIAVIFLSGCTDRGTGEKVELLTVGSMEEIDAMLETRPVFIQIGASWCAACKQQKPVVEELAAKYGDRMYFVYINVDAQNELASQFNIYYIPDMSIIVKSDGDKNIYLTRSWTLTDNRMDARFIGYTSKGELEVCIQNALKYRGQAI